MVCVHLVLEELTELHKDMKLREKCSPDQESTNSCKVMVCVHLFPEELWMNYIKKWNHEKNVPPDQESTNSCKVMVCVHLVPEELWLNYIKIWNHEKNVPPDQESTKLDVYIQGTHIKNKLNELAIDISLTTTDNFEHDVNCLSSLINSPVKNIHTIGSTC